MSGDGIRELATAHRLRCRRDPCGDYEIIGRRGAIFRYGPSRIGVQVGGATLGRDLGRRGVLIERMRPLWGDPVQDGDGEAVFAVQEQQLTEAASVIKAYKRKILSPEAAQKAADRLRRIRIADTPYNEQAAALGSTIGLQRKAP